MDDNKKDELDTLTRCDVNRKDKSNENVGIFVNSKCTHSQERTAVGSSPTAPVGSVGRCKRTSEKMKNGFKKNVCIK